MAFKSENQEGRSMSSATDFADVILKDRIVAGIGSPQLIEHSDLLQRGFSDIAASSFFNDAMERCSRKFA